MEINNQIQKYIIELYGDEYQNNGIFKNIDTNLIEEWREKDIDVIKEIENTIINIEKYFDISDRREMALKCGAFLMDDGYNIDTDKIWNGQGTKAITISEYNKLNEEEKKKTTPVCPGDELKYFGAFGLNWATHNGIYMGTDNIKKFGKIIEVDSHIQPTIENRVYSLTLMMALGYICGSINCYRDLEGFTHHYIGNNPVKNGPRRPTTIVNNLYKYNIKEILNRTIKALKIKIWEYNIQTANCETFTRFIVTGKWIEDSFFYIRILENIFESYLNNYKDSNEISEIYKFLIIIFNKTNKEDIKGIIYKLLKNINKNLVENGNVEFKNFFESLNIIGLDIINNKNQIEKYKNIDLSFNNPNGKIEFKEDNKDLNIKNAIVINKQEVIRQKEIYNTILKNQNFLIRKQEEENQERRYNTILRNQNNLINDIHKLNKKIEKLEKIENNYLKLIYKLLSKIN
jgi:predicted hydrocarbon binding protein